MDRRVGAECRDVVRCMAGLEDGERPGGPPVHGYDDVVLMVIKTVTMPPPDG